MMDKTKRMCGNLRLFFLFLVKILRGPKLQLSDA
jgi:hypothetical protein